jgi:fluoride exporter
VGSRLKHRLATSVKLTPVQVDASNAPLAAASMRPRTRMRQRLLLAIFAGGAGGALARAGLEVVWPATGHGWPWVTFVINIAGTALLAYLVTLLQERLPPSTYLRPLLGTGFCGALTTFSTLQLEALDLAHNGHVLLGAAYALVSVGAGLLAVHVVTALVRQVPVS